MESKLYVGNLSYDTTEDDLSELFAQAGAVRSVALIKDRETGRSKGFAFVEMSTPAEAQKAISLFHTYKLDDRPLTVNIARPREESPRGGPRGGSGGPRGGGQSRGSGPSRGGSSRGGSSRGGWDDDDDRGRNRPGGQQRRGSGGGSRRY